MISVYQLLSIDKAFVAALEVHELSCVAESLHSHPLFSSHLQVKLTYSFQTAKLQTWELVRY
jgi:hypothetical protein